MNKSAFNVPNVLTVARILCSILIFVILPFEYYRTAFVLFVIGSLTDFADGWWARHFHQVTKLGRILDPFADKLLVCGTLIYLAAIPQLRDIAGPECCLKLGLAPWMVVVIVSRELLVTMLRSIIEGGGGDFSAKWLGKIKMGFQCVAIGACFVYLILLQEGKIYTWVNLVLIVSLWGTILTSLHSCVNYIAAASRALNQVQKN